VPGHEITWKFQRVCPVCDLASGTIFPHRGRKTLSVCNFCHPRPLYPCGTGSRGGGAMAERDLPAQEDRFIGLCLAAAAIIIVFIYLVSYS
jgi:hypothetical protein